MAAEASARGGAFIDAPVSGGFELAAAGGLSFMVGGDADAVSRARPVLDAMGSRVLHFGPPSSGQAVKACNNMVVGISMLALCEGFALAERMGLDQRKVLELWMNAGVRSWLLENRCPVPGLLPNAPSSHGYETGFASTLMVKDLESAQSASADEGLPTPFGALALERYRAFVAAGNGALDFSAIYRTYVPD
jgi:3-hydroxyisobutyrate dehydrogenase